MQLTAWWASRNPGRAFARVLISTSLYNLGLSAYLFLFNIFLVNRHFTERTVGIFASATILGTMAGTIPTGLLASRFGPRKVIISSLLLIPPIFAARACFLAFYPQLILSVLSGLVLSGWVVCLVPLASGTVPENKRPFALSLLFATSILSCGAGGFVGGHMPFWVDAFAHAHGRRWPAFDPQQVTLIVICFLGYFASLPLFRLSTDSHRSRSKSVLHWPVSLLRFYAAGVCWAASIGCLTPFINVYFANHLGVAIDRLGTLFSLLQLVEASAVLLLPLILRRMGLLSAIVVTQLSSAGALLLLAAGHGWKQAAIGLCGYLGALHLSEPTIQSLLMNSVASDQRSEASAMYFLATSLAQAGAAVAGGATISRYGYPTLILGAVLAMIASAMLFRVLCSAERPGLDPSTA